MKSYPSVVDTRKVRLLSTTVSLQTWQHSSDPSTIDGSKIYTGSITSDKIGAGEVKNINIASGAVTHDKIGAGEVKTVNIADYAVTETKIATGALAAYQLVKYGKYSSLPDTDTEIAHNLGYVPSLVLVFPGYDSGVFGYVAVKDITASSFYAKASVSGVDLWYAIFK